MDHRWVLIVFLLLFVTLFVICVIHVGVVVHYQKSTHDFAKQTKCFVINLDKNVDRLNIFMQRYNHSDISVLEIERFKAVNGQEVDISKYVTEKALAQIIQAETNGYRLRHYELTRGAVGCFLSHTYLYRHLLKDDQHDFYIVFEDDAKVLPKCVELIQHYIQNAPTDWDIIVFGVIRQVVTSKNLLFNKVNAWWGLFGYTINKKGAKKFVEELDKQQKIDKQIDSMMSLMVQEGKLNVYTTSIPFINHNADGTGTDIQLPVKLAGGVNPFMYERTAL